MKPVLRCCYYKMSLKGCRRCRGERSILVVSPGFLTGDYHFDSVETMDRAIRSDVVINALDARGLYVDTAFKAERGGLVDVTLLDYQRRSDRVMSDVLQEFADATGGTFIHNTNDLGGGMRRLAFPPEYSYVLAFSPKDLKHDGRYHKLKVTVTEPNVSVTAREGYFAPRTLSDPEQGARRDIKALLFSQQAIKDFPFELQTKVSSRGGSSAQLSVAVRIDAGNIRQGEASRSNVMIVSALFDSNGKLLNGDEKSVQMLRDPSDLQSAINVESSFPIQAGRYVVKVVVRGPDGQLSAASTPVEVP